MEARITREWMKHTGLYVVLCAAIVVLTTGCSNFRQTEWGTGIGAATGAAAGYALAGDDSGLEGALIGGALGAGGGYLIGSHLEKEQQRALMQEYNKLLQMDDKQAVNREIDQVGDKVLGDSNGHTSAQERSQALTQLEYAMETAADEMGNRDGSASTRERNEYINAYKDRPLVQIVSGRGE